MSTALPPFHISTFRELPLAEQQAQWSRLTVEQAEALLYDWEFWCRPSQRMPPEDIIPGGWTAWLILAGRGFGKTRIGAEAVRRWARDYPLVNLIGATADDARDIMIEGESGILACCPKDERPNYIPSKRRLEWPSGAVSLIFTADEPERLRGKQHFKLWCDEIAAWRYRESWDQAQFGLRLGKNPQAVVTTTPKPIAIIKELIHDVSTVVTRGTTYENRDNLAPTFYTKIITKYEGTRLGRQELQAEVLDDNPGALWQRTVIDETRVQHAPPTLKRIVVGVDPAVSSNPDSDLTGIVVVGVDDRWPAHYYVLDDLSLIETPDKWAEVVVAAYARHGADRIVGEVNNGGDLIETVLRTKDMDLAYRGVHATRGKVVRAEPISALYEQRRVHHVGSFGALEDEMCDFNPMTSTASPDRMDALVWAITELSGAVSAGTIFKNFWTPDIVYNDAQRPATLSNAGGYLGRYIALMHGTGATTCYVDIIDDSDTLWVDREYVWDVTRAGRQLTLPKQVDALQEFIGPDPRGAQVLLLPAAVALQAELIQRGIGYVEIDDAELDVLSGIRTVATLMSRGQFRIHERCTTVQSQLGTWSWDQKKSSTGDDVPTRGNDYAALPVVLAINNKVPTWRLNA